MCLKMLSLGGGRGGGKVEICYQVYLMDGSAYGLYIHSYIRFVVAESAHKTRWKVYYVWMVPAVIYERTVT